MIIQVHIKPNSRHQESVEVLDGVYEVRVKAKAVDGKANTRLVELLAEHFALSKTKIRIVRGLTSRYKLVEIDKLL